LGYYRATDGSAALSIGVGLNAISPDGEWILVANRASRKLIVQPVGLGESRELPTPGLDSFAHLSWSDDGRYIANSGQTEQKSWNVYVQPIASGSPALVQAGISNSPPAFSPDGGILALHSNRGGIYLYRLNGSQPEALRGGQDSEYPVRFANGGKSLLVGDATGEELVLTLVDLADGHRTLWKRINTEVRLRLGIVVTPDLKYYAYTTPLYSSELYIVDNLR